jgi:hypothetical protein
MASGKIHRAPVDELRGEGTALPTETHWKESAMACDPGTCGLVMTEFVFDLAALLNPVGITIGVFVSSGPLTAFYGVGGEGVPS